MTRVAAAFRGSLGGLLLAALLALRVDLRVERRDWLMFGAYGVVGVALFFIVYVNSIMSRAWRWPPC